MQRPVNQQEIPTDKIAKIWFAKEMHQPFGGELNMFRLYSHRMEFPDDVVHVIYQYHGKNPDHMKFVKNFCDRLNVKLIYLPEIKRQLQEELTLSDQALQLQLQLQLYDIAIMEIESEGGCLAAGSDIIRTLSPCARLGFYKDFDVIKIKKQNEKPQPNFSGLLAPTIFKGMTDEDASFKVTKTSNHLFYCDERVNNFLSLFRKKIYDRYHDISLVLDEMKLYNQVEHFCIFNSTDYKKSTLYLEAMSCLSRDPSRLPIAMKFRSAMLSLIQDEQIKILFLEKFVLETSGPACMVDALLEFGDEYVNRLNKMNEDFSLKIANFNEYLQQSSLFNLFAWFSFENECDTSWIKERDKRQDRWKAYQEKTSKEVMQHFMELKKSCENQVAIKYLPQFFSTWHKDACARELKELHRFSTSI